MCAVKDSTCKSAACESMHVHYMRIWEFVACVHTVILSDHTMFIVKALLIHFNTTQLLHIVLCVVRAFSKS